MHELLDGHDLYAYLRMLRTSDSRLFFVPEGPNDVRALERHVSSDTCAVIPGYGKPSVLQTFDKLDPSERHMYVGLVDRDLDDLVETAAASAASNVFSSDLHDLQSDLLLRGGLLNDLVTAAQDSSSIEQLLEASGQMMLEEVVIHAAATVGLVRWLSRSAAFHFRMHDFPIGVVLKWPAEVSIADIVKLAIHRSDRGDMDVQSVLDRLPDELPATEERMCSGHDLVGVLSVSSQWWANRTLGRAEIELFISGAIRCDRLQLLDWYGKVEAWASLRSVQIWNC